MLTVTRKIELAVLGDTLKKNNDWAFLRKLDNEVWRAANKIISDQWFYEAFENKVMKPDAVKLERIENEIKERYAQFQIIKEQAEQAQAADKQTKKLEKEIESLKKEKNKIFTEARKEAKETLRQLFEVTRQQLSYRMVANEYNEWGSAVYDALAGKINAEFSNDYLNVVQGKRSLRSYKEGMPIPTRAGALKFYKNEDGIFLQWIKGIHFVLVFGRDKSSRKSEIEKILNGEYSFGDSSIQIKDKKIFLLLALRLPEKDTALDANICLRVQAGIQIPVKVHLVGTEQFEQFGDAHELVRKRVQFQQRTRRLQKVIRDTQGGQGRKKKLKALNRIKLAEKNWIRTYNHVLSKQVISYCLRHNAGTILLEEIKELPQNEEEAKFLARNWAGHELKTMIYQKAKVDNINLEMWQENA